MTLPGAALALTLACCAAAQAGTLEAMVTGAGGGVEDAAVVLEPLAAASGARHAAARAVNIEQRGREFLPHVSVVRTGTPIDFPNNDSVKHHVYSFSPAKVFEIKLYAGKPNQPVVFDKPGEIVIGCNIHDWMEAHVLVTDSPYFAKSAAGGRAAIANVPAGRYRLQLWHPRQTARIAAREVVIGDGVTRVSLALDVKPREVKPRMDGDAY
ncbi:Plastocyanin [Noviherbaspirillum humi]|uniref:Plastocyanin n=1 Tax=Noviherbaspirillum humi TaxID=1688639 RepID=A0A239HUA8_9BURK|nr:methylamine utilization protein [Noviherbaspirillum humi]SNS83804.1 Plastocyanin [Noviherbaspirillum humi]